ncbi:hypothetical protein [Streptomyces thermolilacinus]|uniref:Uncharacterized protein n=1 Tax=Streptomyces thermolilacinus SPC6 TaxID=1306406 RepID=A0A1D3DRP4_9ACTN|nr:hypothetical protein [Streptomyces thermolilacinus]OEJ94993.1 hypothetical protein J116_011330 [Streptomyces thermolilacinus SPC6]
MKRIAGTGVAAVALAFAAAGTAHAGGPYVSHGEPLRVQGGPYTSHGTSCRRRAVRTPRTTSRWARGDAYVVQGPFIGD